MSTTRINLLFGFLGSGKTTLARRILETYGPSRRLALIVNEFGDVGVDGDILKGHDIDLIQLSSGCLCCTLKGSLLAAIVELAEKSPLDHIVIEATGVAEPEEMLATFSEPEFQGRFELGPMVTVVDAAKYLKIREMLGPFYEAQIEKADRVILNKLDLASAAVVEEAYDEVRYLNEYAQVRYAERCDVDLEEILDGPASAAQARYTAALAHDASSQEHQHDHEHHHDKDQDHSHEALHAPVECFVLDTPDSMDRGATETLFASAPEGLWRAKGFIRMEDGDWLLQFAMGELELTPVPPRERHYLVFMGATLDRDWVQRGLDTARSCRVLS